MVDFHRPGHIYKIQYREQGLVPGIQDKETRNILIVA